MISNQIKQRILEKAILLKDLNIKDLAWQRDDIKLLILSIMDENIGILGGDVYKIGPEKIIPLSDNWSCSPKNRETEKEYFLRSKKESLDYINKYPIYPNEKILFSLVFTEDID